MLAGASLPADIPSFLVQCSAGCASAWHRAACRGPLLCTSSAAPRARACESCWRTCRCGRAYMFVLRLPIRVAINCTCCLGLELGRLVSLCQLNQHSSHEGASRTAWPLQAAVGIRGDVWVMGAQVRSCAACSWLSSMVCLRLGVRCLPQLFWPVDCSCKLACAECPPDPHVFAERGQELPDQRHAPGCPPAQGEGCDHRPAARHHAG